MSATPILYRRRTLAYLFDTTRITHTSTLVPYLSVHPMCQIIPVHQRNELESQRHVRHAGGNILPIDVAQLTSDEATSVWISTNTTFERNLSDASGHASSLTRIRKMLRDTTPGKRRLRYASNGRVTMRLGEFEFLRRVNSQQSEALQMIPSLAPICSSSARGNTK